jgi:hypothetical protein
MPAQTAWGVWAASPDSMGCLGCYHVDGEKTRADCLLPHSNATLCIVLRAACSRCFILKHFELE